MGLEPAPGWLTCQGVLALAGTGASRTPQAYRRYVEDPVRQGVAPGVWQELKAQVILGGEAFVQRLGRGLRSNGREQGSLRQLCVRPGLAQVIAAVERIKGQRWETFRDQYGDWGRDLMLYLGRKDCALKLREMGEAMGGLDYGSVAAAVHRFQRRAETEPALAGRIRQARAQL